MKSKKKKEKEKENKKKEKKNNNKAEYIGFNVGKKSLSNACIICQVLYPLKQYLQKSRPFAIVIISILHIYVK